ncbi:hypothetical protein B0H10DRAFT_2028357 [Mycena sp. CBHHK59/15]|nr:hypothetical protein B0H10DRAFT_2028357 [Mycena sp. CBHHK59/15]
MTAFIGPMGKLPTEIYCHIFLIYVAFSFEDPISWAKSALRITHVCRLWRRIGLALPRLWVEGLSFTIVKEPTDSLVAMTKTYLERSFPLPIAVGIYALGMVRADVTPLMDVLSSASGRWRSLALNIRSLDPLVSLPPGSLTALEELRIQDFNPGPYSYVENTVFLTAINLRKLTVVHWISHRFAIPWSQLTVLTVDLGYEPDSYLDVMMQCDSLVTASLHIKAWMEDDDDDDEPFVRELLHLETLRVDFIRADESGEPQIVMPLFRDLALPALRTLKLSFDIIATSWSSEEFTQFQLRCPNLEDVELWDLDADSDVLITLIRHAPVLKSFAATFDRGSPLIDDDFMRALEYRASDPHPLAPLLESLQLRESEWEESDSDSDSDSGGPSFQEASLERLIRSRWWSDEELHGRPTVARLKNVVLSCGLSEDLKASLQDCAKEGLKLDLED